MEGPGGDPYQPSALYDVLLALDPRIVFTTNYDKLFETASSNGYSASTGERLVAPRRGRIEPPLEDVAGHEAGAGNSAVTGALRL